MNERIKQLAEQAGFRSNPDIYDRNQSFDMEKFAEMIVAECLAIAKNREDELENANLLKESNAVGFVAYQIARQFGVEEE